MPISLSVCPRLGEDDLLLFLVGALRRDQFLEMESHIEECGSCWQRLRNVAQSRASFPRVERLTGGSERRSERRISTDDVGFLRVLDSEQPARSVARVLDISKNGMRLQTLSPIRLETGSLVQVRIKESIVFGQIRHVEGFGQTASCGVNIQESNFLTAAVQYATHTDIAPELSNYVLGLTDGEQLLAMNEHLSSCAGCQDLLAEELSRQFGCPSVSQPIHDAVAAQDQALLRVLKPFSPRLWEAGVTHASDQGLVLLTEPAISPGSTIQLFFRHLLILAMVRSVADYSGVRELGVWVLSMAPRTGEAQ